MAERPWFETLRTSYADPVLNSRLRRHASGLDEVRVSGCVFDLVTGSCGVAEALSRLDLDAETRSRLEAELLVPPTEDEIREALVAAGRAEDAKRVGEGMSRTGGEYEARQTVGPAPRRAAPPPAPPPPFPISTSETQLSHLQAELAAVRALLEAQRDLPATLRAVENRLVQQESLLRWLGFVTLAAVVAALVIGLR